MEISLKSNLITKVLAVILVMSLILGASALFSTVKATDEGETNQVVTESNEDKKADPEIKLNRKIQFKGNTYKSYKDGAKVRKTYKDGELGEGIILRIRNSGAHRIYVALEGWISDDQVVDSKKYIDITFDLSNLKEGVKSGIIIDGEFIDVDIKNTGVVKFEDGILKPSGHLEGTTDIIFTKKDGTEIPVVAETHDGNITLSIPDLKVYGDFSDNAVLFEKVVVKADGEGNATLTFGEGAATLGATGNADIKLETIDGKEIAGLNVDANGQATASLTDLSLTAKGEVTESVRILSGKIKAALTERAEGRIDKTGTGVQVGGNASVQDQELADGDVSMYYNWGDKDPTGTISGSILGGEKFEKSAEIPVISTIKALLKALPALAK